MGLHAFTYTAAHTVAQSVLVCTAPLHCVPAACSWAPAAAQARRNKQRPLQPQQLLQQQATRQQQAHKPPG